MSEPTPPDAEMDAAIKQAEADKAARDAQSAARKAAEPVREPLSPIQKTALKAAVGAAILCPVWFAVAALGTKFGLWSYGFGLAKMTFQWGPIVLGLAVVISLVALVIQLIKSPRRGVIIALVTLLFSAMSFGKFYGSVRLGLGLPPIHDVQTDWTRSILPPQAIVDARDANKWNPIRENPVVPEFAAGRWPDAAGKSNADLQATTYPDVKPLLVAAPVDVVLEFAEGVALKQGWKIETVDPSAGLIHATYTSTWFGFTDDILIRVTQQGPSGARVDLRSISRVGLSDMGANASRIKSYLDDAHLAARSYGSSEVDEDA